jgi:hypothetical protein
MQGAEIKILFVGIHPDVAVLDAFEECLGIKFAIVGWDAE